MKESLLRNGRPDAIRVYVHKKFKKFARWTYPNSVRIQKCINFLVAVCLASALLSTSGVTAQEPATATQARDAADASADDYERASAGTRSISFGGGTTITMLFDAANLGSDEVELAEIVFAVGTDPQAGHRHGAMEFFYVVEGVLGHVVNGVEYRLEPGMAGVVKPGDEVIHRVLGDVPVRALVVWVPGGESDRIAPRERWTAIHGGG